MKRNNKKGFTIVELVIVIAVIGILAAVLIPTFSGVIADANKAADLQAARNAYTKYLSDTDNVEDLTENNVVIVYDGTAYYGYNADGEFAVIESYVYNANNIVIDSNGAEHDCDNSTDDCQVCKLPKT